MNKKETSVYSIGFWGAPNLGDELICKAVNNFIAENILSDDGEHYVLTNDVLTTNNYHSLTKPNLVHGFFPTPEYFKGIQSHLKAVKAADILTVGGGGLISDKYTWQAIPRYMVDLLLAIALNKKICFVGLGVLNLKSDFYKILVKFIMKSSSGIYLRDKNSKINLENNTHCNFDRKIIIGPDLSHYLSFKSMGVEKDYAVVNVRENPQININSLEKVFLSMDCSKIILLCAEPSDYSYYKKIKQQFDSAYSIEIVEPQNIDSAVKIIDEAKYVFCERLHVSAISAELGKKSLFLAYETKVSNYIKNSYSSYSMVELDAFNTGKFDVEFKQTEKEYNTISNLKDDVSYSFFRVIDKPVKNSFFVRLISLTMYIVFLAGGGLYAFAVSIKRKFFGRGKFKFLGHDFG